MAAILLAGCGGGTSAPSGLTKRVFVSNKTGSGTIVTPTGTAVAPGLQIIDANHDVLSPSEISVVGGPTKTISSGGFTAVIAGNAVSIVQDSTEQVTQTFPTADLPMDLAITPNGVTAFAAVRDAGIVDAITTSNDAGFQISIPTATRLVMSPNGTKLLAFVDNPNTLPINTGGFFVIDVASNTFTAITGAALDQPFSAVFNGSETQAFILNCGPECGGTTASVVSVDFSGASPVFGTPIPVPGATVGLLSGSTLFVAGTPPGGSGVLSVINTGNSSVAGQANITDGLHEKMAMASNNRLYIGASACTTVNDAVTGLIRGCLTIFNTSNSALVFPEFSPVRAAFDVTGIQPISNRTVVYVVDGGTLDIFDTNTDQPTVTQVSIVGQAVDVVQVDP